ncbi:hypothetical protein BC826DRAFT_1107285 [Russula brevipes]|nr:hypothetical protein BC826DRAFT_1107285 [Russula brevipes]
MDDEFPVLETVVLGSLIRPNTGLLTLPNTFRAPQLRYLILMCFAFPIGSPLLTTAAGIVVLSLVDIHRSAYFPPNELIQRLSLMPHLEALVIAFHSPVPNREVERQLLLKPIRTHATLPNLRRFSFEGVNAYLEALLPRMATPFLEKFNIEFVVQLTYSVPCLLQFINAREGFRFNRVTLIDKLRRG